MLFKEINGTCPFCGGNVNIIEGMVFDYCCNKEGIPETMFTEHYKVAGYCVSCNNQVYPVPNKLGGYYMYPVDILGFMDKHGYFDDENTRERLSVISSIILDSTSTEINPFTNIREYNESIDNDSSNKDCLVECVIESTDKDECPF